MWTEKDNKLTRSFTFDNFVEAFAFMTKVALIAEKNGTSSVVDKCLQQS